MFGIVESRRVNGDKQHAVRQRASEKVGWSWRDSNGMFCAEEKTVTVRTTSTSVQASNLLDKLLIMSKAPKCNPKIRHVTFWQ